MKYLNVDALNTLNLLQSANCLLCLYIANLFRFLNVVVICCVSDSSGNPVIARNGHHQILRWCPFLAMTECSE